jgi:hypothetical protein
VIGLNKAEIKSLTSECLLELDTQKKRNRIISTGRGKVDLIHQEVTPELGLSQTARTLKQLVTIPTHTHTQLHGSSLATHRTAQGIQEGAVRTGAQTISICPVTSHTQEQPLFFIFFIPIKPQQPNRTISHGYLTEDQAKQLGGAGKEGIARSLEQEAPRQQPANQFTSSS